MLFTFLLWLLWFHSFCVFHADRHAHTHTYIHIHTHTHSHTHTYTHSHTHAHTNTNTHTHTHTHSHTQQRTQTYISYINILTGLSWIRSSSASTFNFRSISGHVLTSYAHIYLSGLLFEFLFILFYFI